MAPPIRLDVLWSDTYNETPFCPIMTTILLVGAGGFLGSLFRYFVGTWVHGLFGNSFPYGTLAVNVVGCLLIGFLGGLADVRELLVPHVRAIVLVGFLGGFTTFSSFGYETTALFRDGQSWAALANIALQLLLGLGAAWLGYNLSRLL